MTPKPLPNSAPAIETERVPGGGVHWVLHRRPWRESSLLLEIWSAEHGRFAALARGLRGRRAAWRALLQPFQPLILRYATRGELWPLAAVEDAGPPLALRGTHLCCGFYVNELLLRLFQRHDPHLDFDPHYQRVLYRLAGTAVPPDVALREFEYALLTAIGYALQLDRDELSGQPLEAAADYVYDPDHGLRQAPAGGGRRVYSGAALLDIAAGDFTARRTRHEARHLLHEALAPHLGPRPLHSRQLLAATRGLIESGH